MKHCFKAFDFEEKAHIALAVSGGADSMALAVAAKEWADEAGFTVVALHVDHALRNESTAEAQTTLNRLNELGVDCVILKWQHTEIKGNLQEEARNARYKLLRAWCAENGCKYILTAHHAEDQAETIAMRLFRGSGVEGLSAMPALRYFPECQHIRPFLGKKKNSLTEFLKSKNVKWVEDPSNEKLDFDRVKIRKMLALNPELSDHLAKTADVFAVARNYMEKCLAQAISACVVLYEDGYATIDLNEARKFPFEVLWRMISRVITTISGQEKPPRFESIEIIAKEIASHELKGRAVHGVVVAVSASPRTPNIAMVYREFSAIEKQVLLNPDSQILWDRFSIANKTDKTLIIKPFKEKTANGAAIYVPAAYALEERVFPPHIEIKFKPAKPLAEPFFMSRLNFKL